MTQRRILLLLAVVLFIVLSLVFIIFFRDTLWAVIVVPVLGFSNQIQRVWRSLRSDLIWGFFVLFTSLVAVLVFPSIQQQLEKVFSTPARTIRDKFPAQSPSAHLNNNGRRLEFWLQEVSQMYQHQYLARFTVVELKKLVLDEIAFRENYPTRHQAERWLNENPQRVPEQIWWLFNPEADNPMNPQPRRASWMIRVLQSWGLVAPEISPVAVDRSIDAIIEFLEKKTGSES